LRSTANKVRFRVMHMSPEMQQAETCGYVARRFDINVEDPKTKRVYNAKPAEIIPLLPRTKK
jgi:hypothetical protein